MKESYFRTKFGLMYYKSYDEDEKSDSIVLLHGWGMDSSTFNSICNRLNDKFNLYVVDFLGFGNSDKPLKVMTLNDYTECIKEFLTSMKIKNPILIGHSFGGRVAINYGAKYNYKKIFLVNSPAFKNKSLKYYLKIVKYKCYKLFLYIFNRKKYYWLINNSGSADYKNCSGVLKGTFKKIVRKDLTNELKSLKGNVVIISSINDKVVNFKENQKMYELIINSKFYPFYNSNHFSYIEEEKKFINIIMKESI